MFKDRDPSFINAILLQLRYEVFLEGDVIVRQNSPGDRMFFIEHGQVLVATDNFRKELSDGDYFGGRSSYTDFDCLVSVKTSC